MIWRLYTRLLRRLIKPEPLPPCEAVAAHCCCIEPAGHVERGQPVHMCDPTECTGAWTGTPGFDFRIVRLPFSVRQR